MVGSISLNLIKLSSFFYSILWLNEVFIKEVLVGADILETLLFKHAFLYL